MRKASLRKLVSLSNILQLNSSLGYLICSIFFCISEVKNNYTILVMEVVCCPSYEFYIQILLFLSLCSMLSPFLYLHLS